MSNLNRISALASRHRQLGSDLEDWNGMGTAWSYNTNPNDEHTAVREAAGLFDMSPLKRVLLKGPDAMKTINHSMSRDLSLVESGRSVYGSLLTEDGMVCDDAIAANCGANEWLFCHGSGDSMACLEDSAKGQNVSIELNDDLHNISLQGPLALNMLDQHCSDPLDQLAYFSHKETELFGHHCRVSRTGYSGERGYEITVGSANVGDLWDQILGHGEKRGVLPCSFDALDKVRVEAGLLFYGYDMSEADTPWEVGLGFTINTRKSEYRGQTAAIAAKGNERYTLAGFSFNAEAALVGGEILSVDGLEVGLVNSPVWSHRLNKSIALGRVNVKHNVIGRTLRAHGDEIDCAATIEAIPFYDPGKTRAHS